MRRLTGGGALIATVLVSGASAWALTFPQRNTVRSVVNQISGKCQELQQWAQFLDQMDQQDYTVSVSLPGGGDTLTKTYDAAGRTTLQARYDTLKQELTKLVAQLP